MLYFNPVKPERQRDRENERVREEGARVESKRKIWGQQRDALFLKGRKGTFLLGSQAVPIGLCDKDSESEKKLG
jgi:hypothetical protein